MTKRWGAAALIAAVCSLVGCGGLGPTEGDREAVEESVSALGPPWELVRVTNTAKDSQHVDRRLSVTVEHTTPVTSDQLLDVFEAVADGLPDSFRWGIRINVDEVEGTAKVDYEPLAMELNLDPGGNSAHELGMFPFYQDELEEVLRANGR